MTLPNRQLFRIANSTKRRARVLPTRASVALCAAGHPAKKTDGGASADTNGTRSTLEACAPRAYTNVELVILGGGAEVLAVDTSDGETLTADFKKQ
jgi:hypothetical protein